MFLNFKIIKIINITKLFGYIKIRLKFEYIKKKYILNKKEYCLIKRIKYRNQLV